MMYVIDTMDEEAGHTVLVLPPNLCVLNPILPNELTTMRPASKTILLQKVKETNIQKRCAIDTLDEEPGHTVLMLPPNHCVLNPILPIDLPKMRPASKNILLQKIKEANIQKRHVIDIMDGEAGYTVLMLPPNHCVLYPILPTELTKMRAVSKTILLQKIKEANIQKRNVIDIM